MIVYVNNSTNKPSSDIDPNPSHVSFSVIMASHNRKYCIDQAIESVLSQNYDKFELLIVDDCSTDGTDDHIKETYPGEIEKGKIRLIPCGKVGVSGARNIGLSLAKYDWICYLDTDNKMMPSYFETYNRCILENSGYQCFYAKIGLRTSGVAVGKPFSFPELLLANFIDMGTFVHSKALYRELGGHDAGLTRLGDWDQVIRYTALYTPYFIDTIVLDYNDVRGGDRISDNVGHEDNVQRIFAKNILINIDFLAKSLRNQESLWWAVKQLLRLLFHKIKNLLTGFFP